MRFADGRLYNTLRISVGFQSFRAKGNSPDLLVLALQACHKSRAWSRHGKFAESGTRNVKRTRRPSDLRLHNPRSIEKENLLSVRSPDWSPRVDAGVPDCNRCALQFQVGGESL